MWSLLPRLTLRVSAATTARTRCLSSSSRLLNASPEWEQLVGGRQGTERQRLRFEAKYLDALQRKAQDEGITVEELKRRKQAASEAKLKTGDTTGPVPAGSTPQRSEVQGQVVRPLPSAEAHQVKKEPKVKPAPVKSASESPIKPLNDIMDLSKAASLSSTAVSQLWTTYHQAKGFLSAAIPIETYERMLAIGRKYPLFVLPLGRDVSVGEGEGEKATATEMHLLEWAILPPSPDTHTSVPRPSTVLFTPLAEYKARQSYAQPYLILTHYTDLSHSHGVVLMRGEITANVALDSTAAQILAVRMQLFYNNSLDGRGAKEGGIDHERMRLLRAFHETPNDFDVDSLIKVAEITELGGKISQV